MERSKRAIFARRAAATRCSLTVSPLSTMRSTSSTLPNRHSKCAAISSRSGTRGKRPRSAGLVSSTERCARLLDALIARRHVRLSRAMNSHVPNATTLADCHAASRAMCIVVRSPRRRGPAPSMLLIAASTNVPDHESELTRSIAGIHSMYSSRSAPPTDCWCSRSRALVLFRARRDADVLPRSRASSSGVDSAPSSSSSSMKQRVLCVNVRFSDAFNSTLSYPATVPRSPLFFARQLRILG